MYNLLFKADIMRELYSDNRDLHSKNIEVSCHFISSCNLCNCVHSSGDITQIHTQLLHKARSEELFRIHIIKIDVYSALRAYNLAKLFEARIN